MYLLNTCPWFRKLFEVFVKSGKQNLYICRNQVFLIFKLSQERQRMLKIPDTRSIIYLEKMRYIRWCLVDVKLVKGLICSQKRLGFSVNINISVKKCDFEFFLFLLSHRIVSIFLSEILVFGINNAWNRKIVICFYGITYIIVFGSSHCFRRKYNEY